MMLGRHCKHGGGGPLTFSSRASDGRKLSGSKSVVVRSCWLGEVGKLQATNERRRRKGYINVKQAHLRAWLEDLFHNEVLVSGSAAGILGQLAKPFTSALLGKGFNLKLVLKSGGMPSTHSATVSAVATALGLERGLSDSLFGVAVIMASLVMYDAQGVRRAVGKQAEVINMVLLSHMADSLTNLSVQPSRSTSSPSQGGIGAELMHDSVKAELALLEKTDALTSQASKGTGVLRVNGVPSFPHKLFEEQSQLNGSIVRTLLLNSPEELPSVKDGQVTLQEIGSLDGWQHIPLKESVGHTKLEVFMGAIWGILIAVTLHPSVH